MAAMLNAQKGGVRFVITEDYCSTCKLGFHSRSPGFRISSRSHTKSHQRGIIKGFEVGNLRKGISQLFEEVFQIIFQRKFQTLLRNIRNNLKRKITAYSRSIHKCFRGWGFKFFTKIVFLPKVNTHRDTNTFSMFTGYEQIGDVTVLAVLVEAILVWGRGLDIF